MNKIALALFLVLALIVLALTVLVGADIPEIGGIEVARLAMTDCDRAAALVVGILISLGLLLMPAIEYYEQLKIKLYLKDTGYLPEYGARILYGLALIASSWLSKRYPSLFPDDEFLKASLAFILVSLFTLFIVVFMKHVVLDKNKTADRLFFPLAKTWCLDSIGLGMVYTGVWICTAILIDHSFWCYYLFSICAVFIFSTALHLYWHKRVVPNIPKIVGFDHHLKIEPAKPIRSPNPPRWPGL